MEIALENARSKKSWIIPVVMFAGSLILLGVTFGLRISEASEPGFLILAILGLSGATVGLGLLWVMFSVRRQRVGLAAIESTASGPIWIAYAAPATRSAVRRITKSDVVFRNQYVLRFDEDGITFLNLPEGRIFASLPYAELADSRVSTVAIGGAPNACVELAVRSNGDTVWLPLVLLKRDSRMGFSQTREQLESSAKEFRRLFAS